jgi:TRAP-type mannitol/chloroaromatic compound transport system permease small subunit
MTEIQKHMLRMFIALRWGVGFTGIFLPIILAGFGYLRYQIPLAGSMSSYYHATKDCSGIKAQKIANSDQVAENLPSNDPCQAIGAGPMRNWFVRSLFFIGGAMLLMRGFSFWENIALDIAGIMAPCVALFPMKWGDETGLSPHMTFAVTFFACIAFTCVVCSRKTLNSIPHNTPNRAKVIAFYKAWYLFFAIVMVAAPICAHLLLNQNPHRTFFVEAAGVWAFGFYWLFKTFELKHVDAGVKVFLDEVQANPINFF